MSERVLSYTLRNRTSLELEREYARQRSKTQIVIATLFIAAVVIARATA